MGKHTYMKKINSLSLTGLFSLLVLTISISSFAGGGESPVSLASFNARPLRKVIDLEWSTNRETNTNHFIVQRSTDGKVYNEIAVIVSGDNSNVTKTYNYTDDRVVRGKAPVFYRLKIVDRDGRYVYSEAKMVIRERMAVLVY